uniref:Fibronectin type-III domain-containing protein n=1 Tax=Amphimedon queenslandica TaxID=400682 RepID=A0A1X7SXZ6_AMPQE
MATTGIYWCLVLAGCFSFLVSASLVQTIPPYPTPVCPGGRLVLTCTTNGSTIVTWRGDSGTEGQISSNGNPITVGSFNVTAGQVDGVFASYATNESVPVQLNGANIECSIDFEQSYSVVTINIAGIPEAVTNVKVNAINKNILFMYWSASGSCIDHYIVTINSNNTLNESRTTSNTNITIDTLIIGTNYSFIIIPIDTIGREGPPSSLIQYIWNVPAQVVNISWDQISTDSITIWWNNNQDTTTLRPPIDYNVTDTNTTITGLSPINEYYTVTIIPVNVIGYGPSVAVNVSITTTTSSITNIMMSTTEYITMQDKSSAMTALPTITITITEVIISSYIESFSSCITTTMSQATDVGSISVAIAVPITGLLTGLITAIITSIIVCLIMKKRGTTIQNKTPVGGGGEAAVTGPIYDLPTINTEQQEQIIDTKLNTAYGQTNI